MRSFRKWQKCLILSVFFLITGVVGVLTARTQDTSTTDLKTILKTVQDEIAAARADDQKYTGGLVKNLIAVRIQILKTTEALLQEKIIAISTGSNLKSEVRIVQPDFKLAQELEKEILAMRQEIENLRKDAAKYSGGLVLSMKLATIATREQTIAMLEQRYLTAKFGLPFLPTGTEGMSTETSFQPETKRDKESTQELGEAEAIVLPIVTNKRFVVQQYKSIVVFDVEFRAANLEKAARSIKGLLMFCDLFGEVNISVNLTINDPLLPAGSVKLKGGGIEYNQFTESNNWLRNTSLENMTTRFKVGSILYQDGTRKDF